MKPRIKKTTAPRSAHGFRIQINKTAAILLAVFLAAVCTICPAWAFHQGNQKVASLGGETTQPSEAGLTKIEAANAGSPELNFCHQGLVPETRLIVVDKSRQRIMVLRYLGEMMLEREFPCATGVNPGQKLKEGDERTPVGIYFTTHRYKDRKITIFGNRAIHLNYPNPFDKLAGRQGNGIYIHGTNQKLKPRSTNGCIVMRNRDLAQLEPFIKEQLTPVLVVGRLNLAAWNARVRACQGLRLLEQIRLDKYPAALPTHLTLYTDLKSGNRSLDSYRPRLDGLAAGLAKGVSIQKKGYVLVGLGRQWSLVSSQVITKGKLRPVEVIRRYYLSGDNPSQVNLARAEWVLPSVKKAKVLASWSGGVKPTEMAAAKTARVKAAKEPHDPEKQVRAMLKAWMRAWEQKKLRAYLSHYDYSFRSGKMDRKAWGKQKKYLNRVYRVIRVKASKMEVQIKGSKAQVRFLQNYRSDWHRDVGWKELNLVKRKGRWRIVGETWSELTPASKDKKLGASS